jgi:hypothetical protein
MNKLSILVGAILGLVFSIFVMGIGLNKQSRGLA